MLKTNFSLLKLGALIPMIEIFFLWPILPWRGAVGSQRKSLQRERTGLEAEAPERGTGLEAEGFFIKK